MLKGIKAVLFDLDGTLADSMLVWTQIDLDFFASRGIPIPETLQTDIEGMSFAETAQYFIDTFHLPETLDQLMSLWNQIALKHYRTDVELKEGAAEFLAYLKSKGIRTGISTSNSRLLLDVFLTRHGIKSSFDALTTSDEVKRGKPAPDVYLTTARKLGVRPNECLVIEDLPMGIRAGLNAGMKVCAIEDRYSCKLREEKQKLAHYYINSFRDVLEEIGKQEKAME